MFNTKQIICFVSSLRIINELEKCGSRGLIKVLGAKYFHIICMVLDII